MRLLDLGLQIVAKQNFITNNFCGLEKALGRVGVSLFIRTVYVELKA